MGRKLSGLVLGLVITNSVITQKVFAHGTMINYSPKESIELEAKFDNGNPMKNAQVVIYTPNNPTTPWLTSTTDDYGKFVFTPDYTQQGNWTVKVRTAGHGSILNIPIESVPSESESSPPQNVASSEDKLKSETHSSPTLLQKLMMAATGVWGFVGTALFFSRSKK